MAAKRTALGKGLAALIPGLEQHEERGVQLCAIEEIVPNRSQPRKFFDEARLQELAESIKRQGILEPLIVRRIEKGYEIVVGERRWRAAQKAGLKEVPVLVRDIDSGEAFVMSLVENLQREDLNPIEEADGYRFLMEELGLSQEEVASRVGKDRTTVANALRLLRLPEEIKALLVREKISAGHARAILSLETKEKQKELCDIIIQKGLSVREAEALAKRMSARGKRRTSAAGKREELTAQINFLQDSLRRMLATKVRIVPRGKRGKIEIEYYSSEDLDRIVETILGSERKN